MRTHLLRAAGIAVTASALALPVLAEAGHAAAPAPACRPALAFVANHDGTVTAINTATDVAAKPVKVAFGLSSVAITADGRTAYVGNPWASQMAASSYVFPVNAATDKPGKAIDVQTVPTGIAITPNGKTAYVFSDGTRTVTAFSTATNTVIKAIDIKQSSVAIAITPNGKTVYLVNVNLMNPDSPGTVTPISTATNKPGTAVKIGPAGPAWDIDPIAVTPNGKTVYVADTVAGTVTAIRTATNTALKPIKDPDIPMAIAITP